MRVLSTIVDSRLLGSSGELIAEGEGEVSDGGAEMPDQAVPTGACSPGEREEEGLTCRDTKKNDESEAYTESREVMVSAILWIRGMEGGRAGGWSGVAKGRDGGNDR